MLQIGNVRFRRRGKHGVALADAVKRHFTVNVKHLARLVNRPISNRHAFGDATRQQHRQPRLAQTTRAKDKTQVARHKPVSDNRHTRRNLNFCELYGKTGRFVKIGEQTGLQILWQLGVRIF